VPMWREISVMERSVFLQLILSAGHIR